MKRGSGPQSGAPTPTHPSGGFVWTDANVRDALGLSRNPSTASEEIAFTGVTTDTRTAGPGNLFVALVGDRFDGHDFLGEAASRGLGGAVVSKDDPAEATMVLYRVEDTLDALGRLARFRRRALPARVVAVTGSSGKTTVKDLLAASLSGTYRVHATRGNQNNRVGVPLTLLAAPEDADVLVVEMGTSLPGEIAALTDVADPDAAMVTTVSEAHLEGLGSFDGVLEEKLSLIDGARRDATLVVGDVPPRLPERARELRPDVRVAGTSERADPDLRGELKALDAGGKYQVRFWNRELTAPLPGRHGAQNVVLALAMAMLLDADADSAVAGIDRVEGQDLRNELRRIGDLTLLLDCYNANPQSTVASLDLLASLPSASGKVAVLASMLELGGRSQELHETVLQHALSLPLDVVVAIGEFAAASRSSLAREGEGPEVIAADSTEDGFEQLVSSLSGSETVLLKGSRGMRLEQMVPLFEREFGEA